MSPRLLRWVMNVWPPYVGAGIHVRSISADWSEAAVELRARLLNRNYRVSKTIYVRLKARYRPSTDAPEAYKTSCRACRCDIGCAGICAGG